jgi:hypothetical protein
MADDILITQGSGTKVATDEIAGRHFQKIKVAFGLDDSSTDVTAANPFPVTDDAIGNQSDSAYSGSGDGSVIALLKKLVALFIAGFTMSGSVSMADAEGVKGSFGGMTNNPSASITRPNNATTYPAGSLIANATTNTAVTYGPISNVARVAGGSFQIDRMRLISSHTTGLQGVTVRVRLYYGAAPTYVNGDGGNWVINIGSGGYLGSFVGTFEQFNDSACAILVPDAYSPCVKLPGSQQAIFWDIQAVDGFTPQASKTFILVVESKQD